MTPDQMQAGSPEFEQALAELATLLQAAQQQKPQQTKQPDPQVKSALENYRRQPYLYKQPLTEDDYSQREQQISSPPQRNAILDALPGLLNTAKTRTQATAPLMGPMALPVYAGAELATNALSGLVPWAKATDQAVKGVPPDVRTGLPAEIEPKDMLTVPGVGTAANSMALETNALGSMGSKLRGAFDRFQEQRAVSQAQRKSVEDAAAAQRQAEKKQAALDIEIAEMRSDKNPNAVPNASHPTGYVVKDPTTGRFMSDAEIAEAAKANLIKKSEEQFRANFGNEISEGVNALKQGKKLITSEEKNIMDFRQSPKPYMAAPIPKGGQPPLPMSAREEAMLATEPQRNALYETMIAANQRAINSPLPPTPYQRRQSMIRNTAEAALFAGLGGGAAYGLYRGLQPSEPTNALSPYRNGGR